MRSPNPLALALTLLLALVAFPACNVSEAGPGGGQEIEGGSTHEELVELYEEFREFRNPEVENSVPDYTPSAMQAKAEGLETLQQRLAAFDTTGWPVSEKVDLMVVKAEMNGMEFDHRVLRPWSRDPAFYVVINFQFGPKMYGAQGLPSLPLEAEEVEEARQRLQAMPAILEQARQNLTEPAGDLTMLGIRTKNREEGILTDWMEELEEEHPELMPDAGAALASIRDFRGWLEENQDDWTAPSGVGREDYTWMMHNVMLLPYSWEELETITERDMKRAFALMALEEHKNRDLPPMEVIGPDEDYGARHTEAQRELLAFLEEEEVMTVPDYIEVSPRSGGGPDPGETLDYFSHVNYRDPMPLLPHDFLGHSPDARMRSLDDRPIRGDQRAYFIDGQRQDGLATAWEQIMMHLGALDDRPHAKELAYNLLALRAVRAMADLKLHSNEMSVEEAFQYNIDNTPKGWLPENSSTMWHDLELYLRQPGYGVGYLIGIAQVEETLADRSVQLGDEFVLRDFFDSFLDAGLIPISLIHWEITGDDGEVPEVK